MKKLLAGLLLAAVACEPAKPPPAPPLPPVPPPPVVVAPPPPPEGPQPVLKDPKAFAAAFRLRPLPAAPGSPKVSGAEVASVGPETPVYRAGVRIGDVVVELWDAPVDSLEPIVKMTALVEQKGGLWGVLLRDGRRVPFRVDFRP